MSELLDERENKVIQIGNSHGFITNKSYLELAGMAEKNTQVKEAVIHGQHGIFIAYYLPGEQPQLEDIPQNKLENLLEKNGDTE